MNLRIFATGNLRDRDSAAPVSQPFAGDVSDVSLSVPTITTQPVGYLITQRFLDIVLSLIVLFVLFLPCLFIAMLIKLESPGPVLFRQKRVGQNGHDFWFYKFRSMVADAEAQRNALLQMNEASGPLFKIKNDPRVTRVGRIIRKFSLDELPQLFNVLIGDMSLVGPRPALPVEVAQYNLRQRARLLVKPGITGLWQVSGRSDLPFERSIELDLEFITQQSFRLYIRILAMTPAAVLKGRGAY